MEKEILTQIISLLEQSKDEQLWILIALFLGMVFLNLLQAIYTSRIVDRYRNSLKRQEVRFSVYNQIQIEKLSELFEWAHAMKCACAEISRVVEEDKKQEFDTSKLINCNEKLKECFNKNRYIIPKNIKEHFDKKGKELNDFRFNCEILSSKYHILNSVDYRTNPFEGDEALELIEQNIGNYKFYTGSLEAMLFCETLKVKIETHFKAWE